MLLPSVKHTRQHAGIGVAFVSTLCLKPCRGFTHRNNPDPSGQQLALDIENHHYPSTSASPELHLSPLMPEGHVEKY